MIKLNLYVCTNDNLRDPTYISGDDTFLCISDIDPDDDDGNPCSVDAPGVSHTPLVPKTEAEAREFARMFGWTVKVKAGRIMIMTDVPVNSQP